MIRIAANSGSSGLCLTDFISALRNFVWANPDRRYLRRRVFAARRSRVWTIWEQGTFVFSGSKQECEDWLDSQDAAVRRQASGVRGL
jgi:hypothetical protein